MNDNNAGKLNRYGGMWDFYYPDYPIEKTKSRLLNTVARSSILEGRRCFFNCSNITNGRE